DNFIALQRIATPLARDGAVPHALMGRSPVMLSAAKHLLVVHPTDTGKAGGEDARGIDRCRAHRGPRLPAHHDVAAASHPDSTHIVREGLVPSRVEALGEQLRRLSKST